MIMLNGKGGAGEKEEAEEENDDNGDDDDIWKRRRRGGRKRGSGVGEKGDREAVHVGMSVGGVCTVFVLFFPFKIITWDCTMIEFAQYVAVYIEIFSMVLCCIS